MCQLWSVTLKCMRDSKPQRYVQQLKTLKGTRNARNGNKHINEASKQTFANNLFKISFKYTQGKPFNLKICFNILSKQYYNDVLCILSKINESVNKNYLW